MPWVYMLLCADGTYYTGWAADMEERLAVHNSGKGSRYTRARLPVKVVYTEPCADKSSALKREIALKKLSRAAKQELVEQKDGMGGRA